MMSNWTCCEDYRVYVPNTDRDMIPNNLSNKSKILISGFVPLAPEFESRKLSLTNSNLDVM